MKTALAIIGLMTVAAGCILGIVALEAPSPQELSLAQWILALVAIHAFLGVFFVLLLEIRNSGDIMDNYPG